MATEQDRTPADAKMRLLITLGITVLGSLLSGLVVLVGLPTGSFALPGDLNGDGVVNGDDLKLVLSHWGTRVGQPGFDVRADVNGDGVIDDLDARAEARLISHRE